MAIPPERASECATAPTRGQAPAQVRVLHGAMGQRCAGGSVNSIATRTDGRDRLRAKFRVLRFVRRNGAAQREVRQESMQPNMNASCRRGAVLIGSAGVVS